MSSDQHLMNDDLQIKAAGASASGSSNSSGQPTTASSGGGNQNAQSTQTTQASATPTQPVNKRAFQLDEGVDEVASGPAKPEKFIIPKSIQDKYPELIELIKVTESMDDQERQYWFQIMPIMSAEQIEKFRNILQTEKDQLKKLDDEYTAELNRLNEKHLLEWKEFEAREKSRAIQEAEAKSNVQEEAEEAALLAKLSDV